jgi:hypothetical protein
MEGSVGLREFAPYTLSSIGLDWVGLGWIGICVRKKKVVGANLSFLSSVTRFIEQTPGVYNYAAKIWRTDDGCHNIDFNGYLDAHHGYCCGSLPCDIWA